ncbi:NYN domain-containing protein [Kribbella catacumbae]|uniref:NYN domain-containing protein n=1 Tax=Kribbella catacumbae TaxID=460086 RepID=UPI00037E955F|nr:NYN domain-containing protein [Kribbella catacumbae]
MRVGVYIDGYNLNYGGWHQLGKTPGWRWLDIRALVSTIVAEQQSWTGAVVDRIVYCTARIDQSFNPAGFAEQDVYLKALVAAGSVDYIEYGKYITGAGRHWWRKLTPRDFQVHQLRDPAGRYTKPSGW